jgi:hypothetical protein
LGQRLNRNQPPHAHQIVGRDGQPIEPVDAGQSAQFDPAQRAIQLAPAEDALDQLAFALTDRATRVGALVRCEAVLAQGGTRGVLADVRRDLAPAQLLDELCILILRVGTQRNRLCLRSLSASPTRIPVP